MPSMKGKIFMNQMIIKVELLEEDSDTDILRFHIGEDLLSVNLNSKNCQADLKSVFSALLNMMVTNDIRLELEVNPDFNRVMYKEVCNQYIEDLNRELNEVKEELRAELNS